MITAEVLKCVCVCVFRFRRDAATLLEILSAYQKRQIVEFLPYHHCDMMNQQSPDLDCVMELQTRYTQYRHTVLLTGTRLGTGCSTRSDAQTLRRSDDDDTDPTLVLRRASFQEGS